MLCLDLEKKVCKASDKDERLINEYVGAHLVSHRAFNGQFLLALSMRGRLDDDCVMIASMIFARSFSCTSRKCSNHVLFPERSDPVGSANATCHLSSLGMNVANTAMLLLLPSSCFLSGTNFTRKTRCFDKTFAAQ